MENKTGLDGRCLRDMLVAGTEWLERIARDINALNVYPVPDGDTGTNMVLTMRASLEDASSLQDKSVSGVARAIDKGALMGARGNSGVILSQILHGFAKGVEGKDQLDAESFTRALQMAADTAYQALSEPVEGTILTVIRDAATGAKKAANENNATLVSVLSAATSSARDSVLETPELLEVLKEAGVVDAGGHGIFTILEGALFYLKGELNSNNPQLLSSQRPLISRQAEFESEEGQYGFCTQFMIKGQDLDISSIRKALESSGESLIVVGDSSVVRVHIHTQDAEEVITRASSFGEVADKDIRDMDEQHQDFLLVKQGASALSTAVIAVVNGDGLANVFADLGVTAIVPGGQTMNPATMDILNTVEKLEFGRVIILPNNKNVISTAQLVQSLTDKQVMVVPTRTIPQGITAMIEYIPESGIEENISQMEENIDAVRTLEIIQATREAKVNGLEIEQGQFIGLLDTRLQAKGKSPEDTVFKTIETLDIAEYSIVTIYYGIDVNKTQAESLSESISEEYSNLSAGAVYGGQPDYHYIISIE